MSSLTIKYHSPSLSFALILSLLTSLFQPLSGQVLINEICPSNDQSIDDEYGESSDWIELYNAGEEEVNLEGYFLSDDAADPTKWVFPSLNLPAEQFLLVFASDRNTVNTYPHTNFKLSAGGESVVLSKPNGQVVDEINFPELQTDQSIGRQFDGAPELALFNATSPGASNNNVSGSGFSDSPNWGIAGHFFDSEAFISINHPAPGTDIFFTRDGSIPDHTAELYTGPIRLDTTTAIRALAVTAGLLPSTIISRTFFIDDKHSIPVISLIGDPVDLWSWERGILVHGGPNAEEEWPFYGANYWSEEEYPIYSEFFEANGELGIAFRADTEIHGGRGARTNPMKPLRLLVKSKYGSSTLDYPFFEDRERTTYKRLVLRNASGDYNNCHFRDAFLARYFIKNNLDVDVMAHRPVMLYINGVFYGLFNLREKSDAYYLKHNYGVDIDKLDLLEEDTVVVEGSLDIFDTMHQFVTENDMRVAENFQQASAFFDVENIAECLILQSGLNNGDWLHNNIKFWRERKPDARWRYLLFDLDIAMGRHGWSAFYQNNLDSLLIPLAGRNKHADLFLALLENQDYRNYFVNRYADLLNTIFKPEVFRKEVDLTVAEIDPEMGRHFGRWSWPGYDVWKNDRVETIYEYLEERPVYAREDIRDFFDLQNEVNLRLQTYPPGAGSIQISTIEPEELPWEGVYFNGVPVRLTIKPNPFYTFRHWQSDNTIIQPDSSISIRYNFEEDDQITAFFDGGPEGGSEKIQLLAYVDNEYQLQVSVSLSEQQALSLSLYDMRGRLLEAYPKEIFHAGIQERSLTIPNLPNGTYILSARGEQETASVRFIVLGN